MLIFTFIKGVIIGFAVAAPVGPIGFLCIRTTLAHGRAAGFATGAGAAFADTFYAIIGAFGVVLVSAFLHDYSRVLRIVGGVLLVDVGARTIFSPPDMRDDVKPLGSKLVKDFITTFFLTLTNPATLFSFVLIFAMLGITAKGDPLRALDVVAGVFAGSLSWWLLLSTSVSLMKTKITPNVMKRMNMVVGGFIVGFGFLALLSVL